MPLISVIMLTYNREDFVERAIKSILEQRFQDYEMIIVDNGSTDRSGIIADEYAKKDGRIKVIHKEKGNIGSGRNAGLKVAGGKYIAFIDDDDYCMPDFLQHLYTLAEKHDADIVTCGSYKEENGEVLPNGNYLYEGTYIMDAGQAIEKYLWRQLYNCAMPTKLLKKEMFEDISFLENGSYDDICTTYKYFANANKVVADGSGKYVFYRHDGNNSSAATKHHLLNPVQLGEYLKAFRERTEYIEKVIPQMRDLARYSEWSYMISMIEKIHRFELKNCDEVLQFMKDEIIKNKDEFLNGGYILDFEREWVEKFIE